MAFAAQLSNALVEDRIPLNGTVGPYPLSRTDIIPHSQTVRLVTVSRSDASEELQSRTLAPGLDYVLTYTTGQLFLRRPIPAFTPELHRNILVVDYEADEDLRNGLIAGIRAEAELSPRLRAAVSAVHARRVEWQALSITLSGFDLSYRATDELTLSAKVLHARRSFATHSDTGLRSEVRAEFERGGTQVPAYLRRQRGHVALTASDADIDTILSGLSLRHQLWADPETPSERWLLEGQLLAENDRANDGRRRDGEVLLTRERERKTQSLGFRGIYTNDTTGQTRDLRLVYRGTGTSEDGRLTQALGTEVSLRPDAPRAGDKLDLSFGYLLTERWTVFGTFEVESQRQTSIEARRFTFGAEFIPEEGRVYRTALSWAGNDQNQGQALFLGADHGYTLRDGLSAYLGGDVQWDLGAAGVPMGQSIGNPYIAESFIALRAGLRHEAESWGAGADTEWRRTRDTDTGNLRLRMDGELSETWSAGAEALLGLTRTSGADWRHDLKLQASAAHRAGPRDREVRYLVIGGGGGGGEGSLTNSGGGGGLREGTRSVAAGALTIRVGTGGVGANCGTACSAGANGGDSEFDGVIAVGGGRGGYLGNSSGAAGGSGGGGRLNAQGIGGAGTSGQGNAGGSGSGDASLNLAGAGGGGAATAGQTVTSNTGGNGGAGRSSGIDNTTRFYSGGGAGGGYGTAGGSGGIGGGGASPAARGPGQPAQANTGGGGGGATGSAEGGAFSGGNGGSGIVVVRYVINTGPTADAGDSATTFAGQQFERLGIVTDPDNNIDESSISWVQTGGPPVVLGIDDNPRVLRFTPPQPTDGTAETLTFQLTATDAFGLTSTDTVTITLQAIAELTATKTATVFSEDGSDCANLSESAPPEPQNPAAIPGACIAYLVRVENTGAVAAQGINLIDALPASLTLRNAALTSGWGAGTALDFTQDCSGTECTVEITGGVIEANTIATLTIRATID